MRYSRQERFLRRFVKETPKFDKKRIVLVGCGGVGSVLGELLTRGGFMDLVLIDNDLIDETNLGRQNFEEKDLGRPKSTVLSERLKRINSKISPKTVTSIVTKANISTYCEEADLIVDCTDNFETRRVINDYCEKTGKDWIYCGAVKSEIVVCTFYGKDKMFSKIFPEEVLDENCCDVGVLASTTFTAASLAYNQTIKYFLEIREDKLVKIDLWRNKMFEVNLK